MVIDSPYSVARECFGPMAHHFIQDMDKILYSGTRENAIQFALYELSFSREVTVQILKELITLFRIWIRFCTVVHEKTQYSLHFTNYLFFQRSHCPDINGATKKMFKVLRCIVEFCSVKRYVKLLIFSCKTVIDLFILFFFTLRRSSIMVFKITLYTINLILSFYISRKFYFQI